MRKDVPCKLTTTQKQSAMATLINTSTKSQTAGIFRWLKSGKAITPMDALYHFGCLRLGARIWDLRHIYGEEIETHIVQRGNKQYAEYRLKK
jgi:hypothetical protein